MPHTPKLLPGLAIANGLLTLSTAIVFASGGFGAWRPQDTGGWRSTAGLLIAFAAVAFIVFVAAALGKRDRTSLILIGGLALIDGLANGFFVAARAAEFNVPITLHWLTGMTCALVFFVALLEFIASSPDRPSTAAAWPTAMIFAGSSVGGIALLLGIGRFEWGFGAQDALGVASSSIAVVVIGLALFAAGAGAVAATALRLRPTRSALQTQASIAFTAAAGVGAIWTGVTDIDRAMGLGERPALDPWSPEFVLFLAGTIVAALMLGGMLAIGDDARDLAPERHPA